MIATTEKSGYAPIHGLNMYYEFHGEGEPLILLHGGLCSTAIFNHLLPLFAKTRQVIAVDLHAHGRTADIDRPIRYEAMADDMADLMKYLHIENADILGYSLGAGVALQTAARHPEMVNKLVLISTAFKREGWYPDIRTLMDLMGPATAEAMKPSPLYKTYAGVAPRPQDWVKLATKMADLLRLDYDWSKQVAAIQSPTMLVFGDADSMPPSHIAEFFGLLGGGLKDAGWDGSGISNARLAILPGVTHYNIIESPLLPQVVAPFLGIPGATK